MKEMTSREWICNAVENDRKALVEGIKFLFNCHDDDANIAEEGDVWIGSPQRGHWLDEDGLAVVAKALRAGDI